VDRLQRGDCGECSGTGGLRACGAGAPGGGPGQAVAAAEKRPGAQLAARGRGFGPSIRRGQGQRWWRACRESGLAGLLAVRRPGGVRADHPRGAGRAGGRDAALRQAQEGALRGGARRKLTCANQGTLFMFISGRALRAVSAAQDQAQDRPATPPPGRGRRASGIQKISSRQRLRSAARGACSLVTRPALA